MTAYRLTLKHTYPVFNARVESPDEADVPVVNDLHSNSHSAEEVPSRVQYRCVSIQDVIRTTRGEHVFIRHNVFAVVILIFFTIGRVPGFRFGDIFVAPIRRSMSRECISSPLEIVATEQKNGLVCFPDSKAGWLIAIFGRDVQERQICRQLFSRARWALRRILFFQNKIRKAEFQTEGGVSSALAMSDRALP
jgi:hypothetical protein